MSLLLNFLLFVVANGFLGDLVEKTKDDGGEDEPERDEGILGVAELDILGKLGKVLETEWGRCSKKCFLFGMVNFTVLTEPGTNIKILKIVNCVEFALLIEPGSHHWGGSTKKWDTVHVVLIIDGMNLAVFTEPGELLEHFNFSKNNYIIIAQL